MRRYLLSPFAFGCRNFLGMGPVRCPLPRRNHIARHTKPLCGFGHIELQECDIALLFIHHCPIRSGGLDSKSTRHTHGYGPSEQRRHGISHLPESVPLGNMKTESIWVRVYACSFPDSDASRHIGMNRTWRSERASLAARTSAERIA